MKLRSGRTSIAIMGSSCLIGLAATIALSQQYPTTPFRIDSVSDAYDFPVGRYGECPHVAILFGHRDGRGRVVRIEKSYARLGQELNFTNKAGGGCVPNNQAMIVFAERNYNGRSLTIEPGTVYPRFSDGMNNNVTSVRLYSVLPDGTWEVIPQ